MQMRWLQQMIDIGEGRLTVRTQFLVFYHQHVLAHNLLDPDAADIELPVRCLVRAEREQRRVFVGRDDIGGCVHGKLREMAGSSAVIAPLHTNGKRSWPVLDGSRLAYLSQPALQRFSIPFC